MTSSWLQKQRKSDLVELADSVGLKVSDGLKKTELELELNDYLNSNQQLSSDTRVAPFYKRRSDSASSPIKKEIASAVSDGEKAIKVAKRRVTKAAEDMSNAVTSALTSDSEAEPATTRARAARTPRSSALAFASSVPLPPSPSVVAHAIDRRTAVLRRKVSKSFTDSGVIEATESTRESLSSVLSVEALIVLFEAYFLRKEILADRYAFTIPATAVTKAYPVLIPDLFLILTSSFWTPASLWAVTSFFVPLVAAYFFNLTNKSKSAKSHPHFNYSFDPLTFNIVKALLTYVVFAQDVTFGGLVDLESVARINSALYGGWQGVLVGTAIGVLVTFYEAIIKK